MPDTHTPAADAAATTNTDGATPPATAEPSANNTTNPTDAQPGKMGLEQARDILRQQNQTLESEGVDPLGPTTEHDPLELMSDTDPLRDVIEGETEEGETPDEVPTDEAAAEEEEQADESPAAADPAADSSKEDAKGRKRVNIYRKNPTGDFVYNDRERAILQLSEEKGIGFREAEQSLYGDTPTHQNTNPAPTTTEKEQTREPVATASEIDSQITSLKAEKKKAAENLDMGRVVDIDEQLETLRDQKSLRLSEAAQQAGRQASAIQQYGARAVELYPEANIPGSKHYQAISAEVARLERENPAAFNDPRWPLTVADTTAAEAGIARKSAPQNAKPAEVTPAAKPVPVPPKKAARPAPSPAPGTATTRTVATPTADAISAEIESARKRGDIKGIREANAKRAAFFERAA